MRRPAAGFGSLWVGFLASRTGAPLATSLDAALAFVLMIPVAIRLVGSDSTRAYRAGGSA